MTRGLVLSLASVLAVSASAFAEVKSGLQVGDKAPAFNVRDITGPNAGKSLCYRWRYGGKPVINVFAREITPALTSLVKKIDAKIAENNQLSSFVVVLTEKSDATEEELKKLAEKEGIKNVPLTIIEGAAGPPSYKIAPDADVTVMMWVKAEVKANHTFEKGKLDDKAVEQVVADISKILE